MTKALTAIITAGLVLSSLGAASCGGDSTSVDPTVVTGPYTATTFLVTKPGAQPVNQLQAGGSVGLFLNPNGSTTGHLHVAAAGGDPAFDADMAGTWTRTGNTVDLTQSADSFMRDMAFTVTTTAGGATELVGDQLFAGTRVQVTLAHSGI